MEIEKYFSFNQTGNILISTSERDLNKIPSDAKDLFNEVSVFFSALIKALSQTTDPTNGSFYSINDYDALNSILKGSSYFINTSKQELYLKIDQNDDVGRKIIGSTLGIPSDSASLSFSDSMFSSIDMATLNNIEKGNFKDNPLNNRVSTIIFICEYIMGMTFVSVVVLHFKLDESLKLINNFSKEEILHFKDKGILPKNKVNLKSFREKIEKINEKVNQYIAEDDTNNLLLNKSLFNKKISLLKQEIDVSEKINKKEIEVVQSLNYLHFRKDTYTFVSPKALDQYAKEFNLLNNSYDIQKMQETLISMMKNAESEKGVE